MNNTESNTTFGGSLEAALDKHQQEMSTLLLPIVDQALLVPNVTVAEILDFNHTDEIDDVPTWFLGLMKWRTLSVPIISFEALNDQPFFNRSEQSRVAIFNGISGSEDLPFWGLVTQGTPRQMKLSPADINENSDIESGPAEMMPVYINTEQARIPNLDFIEKELTTLLNSL